MEKTKCYQCGLVNWDGAVECRRCFSKLRSASKTVNLDRMPQEGVPQVKPVRFGVLAFLVLAGLIGFAAYKSLLPEERPSAASEAGRQLDEYGSTMTEPQKQAFKLKAASEAALKLEGEAAVIGAARQTGVLERGVVVVIEVVEADDLLAASEEDAGNL